ncbi:MAG TPA: sigma-70 family RNA polymerase sigma factor [Gemmatimonadales bacterium]|nr:sigma-70 family RNA polymerase sigma factor [Gemmatimonadales bacterium]
MDDPELAARLARGDDEAFSTMARRYAAEARRVARVVLHDDADADDAVQDAFLSAWRNIARYDPARPFRPWLMRIVLNAARNVRRRERVRRAEPIAEAQPSPAASPEQETARALLRERLAAAMALLPERARLALMLFDAEGYTSGEIAEMLGRPEGTIRSDVFHARRVLRARLAPHLEDAS